MTAQELHEAADTGEHVEMIHDNPVHRGEVESTDEGGFEIRSASTNGNRELMAKFTAEEAVHEAPRWRFADEGKRMLKEAEDRLQSGDAWTLDEAFQDDNRPRIGRTVSDWNKAKAAMFRAAHEMRTEIARELNSRGCDFDIEAKFKPFTDRVENAERLKRKLTESNDTDTVEVFKAALLASFDERDYARKADNRAEILDIVEAECAMPLAGEIIRRAIDLLKEQAKIAAAAQDIYQVRTERPR